MSIKPPKLTKRNKFQYTGVFGKDFTSSGGALTLDIAYVNTDTNEFFHNKSGWFIKGKIMEDYYEWVNAFEAWHPKFGWVIGDFENEVKASTKKGFDHFYKNHTPTEWDYWDI